MTGGQTRSLDITNFSGRYLLFVTPNGHAAVSVDAYARDAHPIFDRVQDALDADKARASLVRPCVDCETWIDSRCPGCGCCNHCWKEDTCPCMAEKCGCRENREWFEAEERDQADV